LPVVGQLRAWSRFGIFAFAAATFLSAYLFRFLLTRYSSRTAIPLIAVLIVIVAVVDQYPIGSFNFPRHKTEVPSALSEIKADQGDFFVLDLPLVLPRVHSQFRHLLQLFATNDGERLYLG
jgi:hypothetical protein